MFSTDEADERKCYVTSYDGQRIGPCMLHPFVNGAAAWLNSMTEDDRQVLASILGWTPPSGDAFDVKTLNRLRVFLVQVESELPLGEARDEAIRLQERVRNMKLTTPIPVLPRTDEGIATLGELMKREER